MALKRQPRQIPTFLLSLKMHFDSQTDHNKEKEAVFAPKLSQRFKLAGLGNEETLPPNTKPTYFCRNVTSLLKRRQQKDKNHQVKCQFGSSVLLKLG